MSHKYVVTNVDTDEEYCFYDVSKFDTDGRSIKLVNDGLKEATAKYAELHSRDKFHKLILTKVYPDYHTGEIKTDLIQSNV